MALENALGELALDATLQEVNTKLDAVIAELSQKLEAGQAVALDASTLAALETISAAITNWPGDFPDAAVLAKVEEVRTLLAARLPVLVSTVPDTDAPAIPVRQVPTDLWRCSFASVGAGVISAEMNLLQTGAGMAVNQAGGNLVITSGTTANSETLIQSVKAFNGSFVARMKAILSQRIVNNNFSFELADLVGSALAFTINSATSVTVAFPVSNPFTAANIGQSVNISVIAGAAGIPGRFAIASVAGLNVTFTVAGWPASGSGTLTLWGWNYHRILYNGTTATAALADAQRRGWASGDTTLAVNTTASPGHVIQIENDGSFIGYADSVVASNTAYQFTARGSRIENIPEPNDQLYLFIRVLNGTTNPATTTTFTVGFVSVEELGTSKVFIAGATQNGASHALPVTIFGTPAVTQSGTWTVMPGNTANTTPWLTNPLTPAVSTTGDTGAKTVTGNGATQTNASAKGAHVIVNVGAVAGTTPTAVFKLQGSADGGTTWYDIPGAVTASIIATGAYGIMVYPGLSAVAGAATPGTAAQVNSALPRSWRVVWTLGGTTPSFTITNIQVNYII